MTFQEIINQDKPVLIDFSAEWCGPCKMMAPVLQQVKKKVGDNASIVKIDVDRNPQISAQFKIRGVPTFILFKDGEQVWRQSGMQSADFLENLLNQHATV